MGATEVLRETVKHEENISLKTTNNPSTALSLRDGQSANDGEYSGRQRARNQITGILPAPE